MARNPNTRCQNFDHIWSAGSTILPQRRSVFPSSWHYRQNHRSFFLFGVQVPNRRMMWRVFFLDWPGNFRLPVGETPLVISIIFTIHFAVFVPLVAVVFVPHSTRKGTLRGMDVYLKTICGTCSMAMIHFPFRLSQKLPAQTFWLPLSLAHLFAISLQSICLSNNSPLPS